MTRARTQSAAVLAVVLALCTLAAAPVAAAAPGDTTSGTTIGDQLGGSGDDSDGVSGEDDASTEDSGEQTDESSDDQQSTDDSTDGSTDGSTDDASGDDADDSTTESDDSWDDEGSDSVESIASNVSETTESAALTERATEDLAADTDLVDTVEGLEAVTAADLADATEAGAETVPTLDAESFATASVSRTTSTTVEAVDASATDLFTDTTGLLGVHEPTTSTDVDRVAFPVAQLDSAPGAASSSGAPSTNRAGVGGASTGGSTPVPAGPATGLALGVGAVAAAAVGRVGAVAPVSLANLGSALTAGLAPVAGRVSVFDRLFRMLAPFRYSRYDDSDPLEHDARADVYDVVNDAPGAYLSEVADEAGLPLSTARHHIRVLEREDLVSGAKVRGKRRFYPAYTQGIELAAALNDEATAAVIDAISRLGASSVSDLADELGRDPSTVSHHLKRLAEDDIIVRERDGRAVMNKLSAEARTALEPGHDSPTVEAGEALASD